MNLTFAIPSGLMRRLDDAATVLHTTRNELCRRAVQHYLDQAFADAVTAKLDAVYGEADSRLDADVAAAQFATLDGSEW